MIVTMHKKKIMQLFQTIKRDQLKGENVIDKVTMAEDMSHCHDIL